MVSINVIEAPNCTWVLEGQTFFCTHDEVEIYHYDIDHEDLHGYYVTEHRGYICADPDCNEVLEGDPDEDEKDLEAEIQLMQILGK